MSNFDRADLAKWITGLLTAGLVAVAGITALDHNSHEINQIEAICYQHGGHMAKAPYSDSYMTCVGQTR